MTEQELRARVVAAALGHKGQREADGSHRGIIDAYNAIRPLPRGVRLKYTDPWCAAFVSAVGAELGLTETLLPECSCEAMLARYRDRGLWREADDALPRPGDLVFYHWADPGAGDCVGVADHVGLVTAADAEGFTTLEGNYADAVTARRLKRNAPTIRGFACPDYAGASAGAPAAAPAQGDRAGSVSPASFSLPTLKRGDRGETVRALQLLLIGRGFACGPWGADGTLGDATEEALRRFQAAGSQKADGLCGSAAWAALLGLDSPR